MRVRATAALGITTALLTLPACSPGTATDRAATTAPHSSVQHQDNDNSENAPLSSAALETRLLTQHDLGDGYVHAPQTSTEHDDVTVVGCPALDALGGEAATGGSLDFPRQAKTGFTYDASSGSELSEELYSDTAAALSADTSRIFDAMTGCPTYEVLVGGTAIDVSTRELAAPQLGDEQWSLLMTFTAGGHDTVLKQTAIRQDQVLLVLSGSPALVDLHLDEALAKVTAAR
ncbi:hypothetical protein [Streptomyces sp. NPDC090994]|uniref:hypothetical protein n=1 Tax=Streptomyces sp. NPDC090994 TaxID=3365969 RepID=UPI00382B4F85